MARPRTVTNEFLLESARQVFLRDGFTASTVTIASQAGVSEATLYKRFPTKISLFHAAMGLPDCCILETLPERVGQGNVRAHIQEVATGLLEFYRELVPRMVTMRGAPVHEELKEVLAAPDSPPRRVREHLSAYLKDEMDLGRLRKARPGIMAQTMLGTLHSYAFLEHVGITGGDVTVRMAFVDEFIGLLWAGMSPQPEENEAH